VWVERLQITGFKRLSGTFDFDPRLTVVVGPNEAGKSSIGEAFVRSLWGFERGERRRREAGSPWERCRPWDGGGWRIVASLVDHDGRRLRAEWDFGEHEVRLLDAVTGEDLSEQVAAKRGDVKLGTFLTGVSFGDFREVCLFDQHTLAEVQGSDSLVNAMQRAVETIDSDVGLASADGPLRDFLNTQIGARSDSYGLLAGGPLQRELNERELTRTRIENAQSEEVELSGLARELAQGSRKATVLRGERLRFERAIRSLELTEARAVHREAARQVSLATTAGESTPTLDERLVNAAREAFGVLEHADRFIANLEQEAERAKPEIAELRMEERDVELELDALRGAADLDRSAEPAVRQALTRVRQADAETFEPLPAEPTPDPGLARYRDLRGELLALAGRSEVTWSTSRIAVGLAVAVLSVVLSVVVTPVALIGLAIAAVLIATARSVDTGAALATRLRSEFGVDALDELERRAREEDEVLARTRALRVAAEAAQAARKARRDEGMTELAGILDGVFTLQLPLLDRAERYLEACGRRITFEHYHARLQQVRGRLHELSGPDREAANRRTEREARRTDLRGSLAQLEIEGDDLAAARENLDAAVRRSREAAEKRANTTGAQEALDALLAGRTLEELEQEVERAELAFEAHQDDHGELEMPAGDLPSLRPQLKDLEQRLSQVSELDAALRAQIAERESHVPDVPQLKEHLASLERSIDERELALEAIKTAREALKEAARQAHRNFAPHLQRALQRSLPLFTSNRYRDATIADDLSISVIAPETSSQVPADCLSFGTRDQIYLVQRLEIAKMLVPTTGPVPLLLDEAFAEFDEERERSAVRLLCREAAQRQVVLFSKDARLVDLVTEVWECPHVIELDGPAEAPVAA
jgi:recombinational DNA repair ATPase RecF